MPDMLDVEAGLRDAVGHFWKTRAKQHQEQGKSGRKDAGSRGAVTGGSMQTVLCA